MSLTVKRPERLVKVCLDGSLVAKYEAVQDQLEAERRKSSNDRRMNNPLAELERRKAELFLAQEAESVTFRIQALPRAVWSELKIDNPPRKDNDLDDHYGFNTDSLFDAAMQAEGAIVEVTKNGEPVEFTGKDWPELSASLTAGQFGAFQVAIKDLNGGSNEVPFSPVGYKMIQDSGAKSK